MLPLFFSFVSLFICSNNNGADNLSHHCHPQELQQELYCRSRSYSVEGRVVVQKEEL
jgi:hypothetical protein